MKKILRILLLALLVSGVAKQSLASQLHDAKNQHEVENVLQKNPNAINDFLATNPNLKKTPYWLNKTIFKQATGKTKTKLADILQNMQVKGGLLRNFIQQKAGYLALKKFPEAFPNQIKAITQSENHFEVCKKTVKHYFSQHLRKNKDARKVFKQILDKEKEEHEKGCYTFVHAQKWQWHFLAETFKLLWEIKYEEQIDNYQFLRFLPKEHNAKKEKNKRENALNGNDNGGYWSNNGQEAERLFMNYALFANSGVMGRCSAWYWLRDHDQSNPNITVYDLLKTLDLEHLYEKHKTKFKKLEKLHKKANNKYGNILLLSFDQDQLKECVIPAEGGGRRNAAYINGKSTYDVKEIVDSLRNNPSSLRRPNEVMFCTVLTQDYALDPHKGPGIYAFSHTEEKQYKKYKKLWQEIKQDLEQPNWNWNFRKEEECGWDI